MRTDLIAHIQQRLAANKRPTLAETRRLLTLLDRMQDDGRAAAAQAAMATAAAARLADLIDQWNGLVQALDAAGIAVVGTENGWQARLDGTPAGPLFATMHDAYAWALQQRLGHKETHP